MTTSACLLLSIFPLAVRRYAPMMEVLVAANKVIATNGAADLEDRLQSIPLPLLARCRPTSAQGAVLLAAASVGELAPPPTNCSTLFRWRAALLAALYANGLVRLVPREQTPRKTKGAALTQPHALLRVLHTAVLLLPDGARDSDDTIPVDVDRYYISSQPRLLALATDDGTTKSRIEACVLCNKPLSCCSAVLCATPCFRLAAEHVSRRLGNDGPQYHRGATYWRLRYDTADAPPEEWWVDDTKELVREHVLPLLCGAGSCVGVLGSGTSSLARDIATLGNDVHVIATDVAAEALSHHAVASRVDGIVDDAVWSSLRACSLDVVVDKGLVDALACCSGGHAMEARVADTVHRILRPGGTFLLICGSMDRVSVFDRVLDERVYISRAQPRGPGATAPIIAVMRKKAALASLQTLTLAPLEELKISDDALERAILAASSSSSSLNK